MNIIARAILNGLIFIPLAYLSMYIIGPFFKVELPEICDTWNDNNILLLHLFLIGFMTKLMIGENNDILLYIILTLLNAYVSIYIMRMIITPNQLPIYCKAWNDNYVMEFSLLFAVLLQFALRSSSAVSKIGSSVSSTVGSLKSTLGSALGSTFGSTFGSSFGSRSYGSTIRSPLSL
jgi:hypothetical protein